MCMSRISMLTNLDEEAGDVVHSRIQTEGEDQIGDEGGDEDEDEDEGGDEDEDEGGE